MLDGRTADCAFFNSRRLDFGKNLHANSSSSSTSEGSDVVSADANALYGAHGGNRTLDLFLTKEVLYH